MSRLVLEVLILLVVLVAIDACSSRGGRRL